MGIISEKAQQRVNQQNIKEQEAAEAIASKNFNFVQVQKAAFKEMRRLAELQPSALQILMLFGEKMNRQNGILMSQQTIMEITGLSRASVQRGIKLLEDEKWVQPVKIGTAKAYVINSRVFWQADGKTKLASFSAQIVASAAEQDYKPEDWDGVRLRHFPILHSDERIIVGNEKLPPPDQGELSIA